MNNQSNPNEVVITGVGMVTSKGVGLEANANAMKNPQVVKDQESYSLKNFKPVSYLSDKRMLKAVSEVDAYGLVATEELKKNSAYVPEQQNPDRVGIYVGASPASVFDNQNYFQPIRETLDADGQVVVSEFGKTFVGARPTTLLVGLPNNVLCYAAMIFNAKGPNSNYTNLETSGHLALNRAAQYVALNKLDYAVAGGCTAHTDPCATGALRTANYLKTANGEESFTINPYQAEQSGTIMADGSVFVSLERRSAAEKRNAEVLATFVACHQASEATGPGITVNSDEAIVHCIESTLKSGGISAADVGVVFTTGYGIAEVDAVEMSAIKKVFTHSQDIALATSAKVWGNLMESGGVGEVGLAKWLLRDENGQIPQSMQLQGLGFAATWSPSKPHALILRVSPQGDCSALLIRV
jgi:3-oxoacyl-[acyl-carrier-protein] synthase II